MMKLDTAMQEKTNKVCSLKDALILFSWFANDCHTGKTARSLGIGESTVYRCRRRHTGNRITF
jgi:hypothetical protein